jgi:hypothetical protein
LGFCGAPRFDRYFSKEIIKKGA